MRLGGASGDDANDFFVVFLIECVDNQENRTRPYGSHRYPAFLILTRRVTLGNRIGVVENQNSSFEADIMLATVLAVLLLIPFISHSGSLPEQDTDRNRQCQYICTYIAATFACRFANIRIDYPPPLAVLWPPPHSQPDYG